MAVSVPRSTTQKGEVEREREDQLEQVKHTIQLPLGLWSKLGQRAKIWGITKSEAIRRAIWLFTYVAERMDEGSEIVVHRPDGREERLVISPY